MPLAAQLEYFQKYQILDESFHLSFFNIDI